MKARMTRIILSLAALSLSACAFGTRYAELHYPPKDATPIGVAPPEGAKGKVGIVTFSDLRSESDVGEVRNGWGMHTASVVASSDVPAWVTEAVRYELEQRGFAVEILKTAPAEPGALWLQGQVLNVYCRGYAKYEGEVDVLVRISRGTTTVSEHRYDGKDSSSLNWAVTSSGYSECLVSSLQIAARQIADAVATSTMSEPAAR
jgi:hypothetical protein